MSDAIGSGRAIEVLLVEDNEGDARLAQEALRDRMQKQVKESVAAGNLGALLHLIDDQRRIDRDRSYERVRYCVQGPRAGWSAGRCTKHVAGNAAQADYDL